VPQPSRSVVVAFAGISGLLWVSACLTDPEEARYPTGESAPEPEPAPPRALEAQPAVAKMCPSGTRRATDGLIDDLEDGDTRAAPFGGRTGTWWVAKADRAAVTVPAGAFASSDGGAAGSKKAARFAGKTDSQDQWGAALGLSFVESGAFYDASKYAGIGFKIKASKPNFAVRVKLPDVNTVPEGGVCKTTCWNSFGKDLSVGADWQDVVVTWGDLAQQPDWGNPRPPGITTTQIKNVEWAVSQGVEFDVTVDDIHFVECG
jgi:hypothetical protein